MRRDRRCRRCVVVMVATVAALTVTVVPAGSASAAKSAADAAIAEAGLITLADLPAGYAEAPEDSDDSPGLGIDAMARKIPECRTLRALLASEKGKGKGKGASTAKAESPDYESQTGTVSSEVRVVRTVAASMVEFAVLRGPAVNRCLPKLLRQAVIKGLASEAKDLPPAQRRLLTDVTVTVGDLPLPPSGGDERAGFRIDLALAMLPDTPFTMDLVFLRVGRATGSYFFFGLGDAPASSAAVLTAVAGRLAAAQA